MGVNGSASAVACAADRDRACASRNEALNGATKIAVMGWPWLEKQKNSASTPLSGRWAEAIITPIRKGPVSSQPAKSLVPFSFRRMAASAIPVTTAAEREQTLVEWFRQAGSVAIGFSGG